MQSTPDTQLDVAAYVRVSTDDQDAGRQRDTIEQKYGDHTIDWFVDLAHSGSSLNRAEYQRLRESLDDYDVVAANELDRLGRSFAELGDLVRELNEKDIGLDLVSQPIGTVAEDDWMQEMMLKMMIVFADAEQSMIRDRVQQGVDRAIENGKRVGRPPFGYKVKDGFLYQKPEQYARAQQFIREVKKGREKKATGQFFNIPEAARSSILERSEQNYGIAFDDDVWEIERAKVKAGEKELEPLGEQDGTKEVGENA